MKFRWEKKYLYWGITGFLVIISCILFFMLLNNVKSVKSALDIILSILSPFIIGVALAYILNPLVMRLEKYLNILCAKLKKPLKKQKSIVRGASVAIAVVFALLVVAGLIWMLVPQLISSIANMVGNMSTYITNFEQWIIHITENDQSIVSIIDTLFNTTSQSLSAWIGDNVLPHMDNIVTQLTSSAFGVLNTTINILVAVILTVYILFSKEKFIAQCKKVTYAVFNVKTANKLLRIAREANRTFGGFILGKIIDSAIIGILCFVIMTVFNWLSPVDFPFVLLISVVIGMTNVIPFFGPFIGAIPCGLLILMINPLAAFYFAIFILLLQQFDGNILGPKILGNSTGLSAFWVMFAILVGGGLFGFMGMLLGVPTFAVIYTLLKEIIDGHLKKHELPVKTEAYYNLDHIDLMTDRAVDFGEPPETDEDMKIVKEDIDNAKDKKL